MAETDIEFVNKILSHTARVQDLRFDYVREETLSLLSTSAPPLRTLVIFEDRDYGKADHRSISLFDGWKTPQLQTVVMIKSGLWQRITSQQLRQLVIKQQRFDAATVEGLFNVLSSNTLLQDLIISGVTTKRAAQEDLQRLMKTLPHIEMPMLERLKIQQWESSDATLTLLLNSKLSPSAVGGWARHFYSTEMLSDGDLATILQSGHLCPARKLSVFPCDIFATDGHCAYHILFALDRGQMSRTLRYAIQPSHVEELFLAIREASLTQEMAEMHQVRKLVIPEGQYSHISTVPLWLNLISLQEFFPALQELSIVARSDSIGYALLRFLRRRKNTGRQLRILRIQKDPEDSFYDKTFYSWRRSSWKFRRLVDQVVFEEPQACAQLELPSLCTVPSPIHAYWEPWVFV